MIGLVCDAKPGTLKKKGVDETHGTRMFQWFLNS